MPRPTPLALLLLAACEHADRPTLPPPPTLEPEPVRVEPIAEVAAEPAPPPALAPPVAPLIRPARVPTAEELDRRCMSRAGCRWEGEVTRPRVVKREAP